MFFFLLWIQIFARQLQSHGGASSPQGRRVSDLCVSCKNPVFLAERLMVNGRLHHRVCFRCARCQSQLSLANYYETEQEQYCCETCPDEVASSTKTPAQTSTPETEGVVVVSGSSSSAIVTPQPVCIQENVSVHSDRKEEDKDDQPQVDRPNIQQQRRFLDSMVAADDVVQVEVTRDSPPVLTRQRDDDDDDDAADDDEKKNSLSFVSVENAADDVPQSEESTRVVCGVTTDVPTLVDGSHSVDVPSDPLAPLICAPDSIAEENVTEEKCMSSMSSKPESTEDLVVAQDLETRVEKPVQVVEQKVETPLTESSETSPLFHEEKVDVEKISSQSSPTDIPFDNLKNFDHLHPNPNDSFDQKETSTPLTSPVIEITTEGDDSIEVVVPKPRRRKSKRSTTPQRKMVEKTVNEYPEELNPFDDEQPQEGAIDISTRKESADQDSPRVAIHETPKKLLPAPKICLNPFGSDDEDEEENNINDPNKSNEKVRPGRPPPPVLKSSPHSVLNVNPSPSPKKRPAPAPPPPKPQRTPALSGDLGSISRRKSAPLPPNSELETTNVPVPAPRTVIGSSSTTPSPKPRHSSATSSPDTSFSHAVDKAQKDLSNLHLQCGVNKDSHGQWKRKKGPAPPRPSPQKRQLRKLPLKGIQQELDDIEIKQVELERQGVNLEQNIRNVTEPEDGSEPVGDGIQIEEMILQLFDLVNEKNELLRRQTELMYIRRQQRLEEDHAELEFQIRCLLEKPNSEKTEEDRSREEELIER